MLLTILRAAPTLQPHVVLAEVNMMGTDMLCNSNDYFWSEAALCIAGASAAWGANSPALWAVRVIPATAQSKE